MKEQILAFLGNHPNSSPAAIASGLPAKPASVRKALTLLLRATKIGRCADGTYILVGHSVPPTPETVNP